MIHKARRSLIIKRGSRERFPTTMTVDASFIKTTQPNIHAWRVADSIGRDDGLKTEVAYAAVGGACSELDFCCEEISWPLLLFSQETRQIHVDLSAS